MKSGILEVDDLDIQDERYVDQAMDIIGKLLGQIQYELETQLNERIKAIKNPVRSISSPHIPFRNLRVVNSVPCIFSHC